MKDLLAAAIKQGKEVKLFFIDGTELDGIQSLGSYKTFDGTSVSIIRHTSPSENIIINLNLVKYFTAS